ncbi:MAG: hypothetical protein C0483_25115 [Pirellula sp.]|nr:hypothetical protein [Pirellula sp.]
MRRLLQHAFAAKRIQLTDRSALRLSTKRPGDRFDEQAKKAGPGFYSRAGLIFSSTQLSLGFRLD